MFIKKQLKNKSIILHNKNKIENILFYGKISSEKITINRLNEYHLLLDDEEDDKDDYKYTDYIICV